MTNWLTRATQKTAQSGHEPNSRGTPDGGGGVGGMLFPGQGWLLFNPKDEEKEGRDARKKNKRKKPERPGEPIT